MMDALITGCDTDLGRTIAESFSEAGHRVMLAAPAATTSRSPPRNSTPTSSSFDNTDPASIGEVHGQFPAHLDTIVNVPAPCWTAGDPRTYTLADHAAEWRGVFDATLLSAVLTVQVLGDHLRSGGSIVTVIPDPIREGSADAAVKAAVSDWTAGQAHHFGIRGHHRQRGGRGPRRRAGLRGSGHHPAAR